jgi:hypothetical protein
MAAFEAVNGQAQSESTLVRKVSWEAPSSMRLLSCWLKMTPVNSAYRITGTFDFLSCSTLPRPTLLPTRSRESYEAEGFASRGRTTQASGKKLSWAPISR